MTGEKKNMIKVKLITLCDYSSVSREGKLSINGIFDEFRTTILPGVLGRGFLVATMVSEPNTRYKLKIKLVNEDSGDSQTAAELEAFSGQSGKHNLVVEMVGARFLKEGNYSFKIFHGDEEIGSVALSVIYIKQAEQDTFKTLN